MKKLLFVCAVTLSLLTLQYCRNDNREKVNGDNPRSNARPQKPVKMIDYLVGEWKIDSVKSREKNPEDAGDQGRTLTLRTRPGISCARETRKSIAEPTG